MKNYEINVFNKDELINKYNEKITDKVTKKNNEDIKSVIKHNNIFNSFSSNSIEDVIYNLCSLNVIGNITITKRYDYSSFVSNLENGILYNENASAENRGDIFISHEGLLYSGYDLDSIRMQMPIDISNEFKFEKYSDFSNSFNVLLDKDIEDFYLLLKEININIIGISEKLEDLDDIEEDLPNTIFYINFLIDFSEGNKKIFIEASKKYLENKVNIKGPTIDKLKNNLFEKIYLLDKEYGTKGNDINFKIENNTELYLILLLMLDGQIKIYEFNTKEIHIDIIDYGKISFKNNDNNDNNNEVIKLTDLVSYDNKEQLLYYKGDEFQLKKSYEATLIKILCSNIGHYFDYEELKNEFIKYGKEIKTTEDKMICDKINGIKDNIGRPTNKLNFMKDIIDGYKIYKY